ncbi:TPR repeat-containing protein [Stanieria cyanosphaera PCC 7437]|uniref:TPR repeat-containing protein n=1 Tax=Stanieria cyanosphaera (strain ATCC 29371 / PCC 7437) TaxID=111780 RepID=K9XVV2_STAC7|nr:tetratricopeptide repeat protein [Stanieria cyanosphaera]AFZ36216.1 TPR repeat-containing protein [Stanieria cyanosphaera PCC 7437]
MTLNSENNLEEYNLLSIGQRGVGKTVFLVGSYLEINNAYRQNKRQKFCIQSPQTQALDNLKGVIDYVKSTSLYPPPTLKISQFPFILQRHNIWGKQNICRFNWWDLPGEFCELSHPDFQQIVMNSHSCCLFINAYELINNNNYLVRLEPIIKQGIAIASVIKQHNLKYNFALIFTQCDRELKERTSRVETGLFNSSYSALQKQNQLGFRQIQIEEKIQPLIERLDKLAVNYKRFYSAIPIEGEAGNYSLQPIGTAAPLLWLTSQLVGSNSPQLAQNLENSQKLEFNSRYTPKKSFNYVILLILALVSSLSASAVLAYVFNWFRPNPQLTSITNQSNQLSPEDFDSLVNRANQNIQQGNLEGALPIVEQIVQKQPNNLNWQLNLAKIYELKHKPTQAEVVYDRILQQESNNLSALIGKAVLRQQQGDSNTAKNLLQLAEQSAPTVELKDKVRAIANSLF